MKTDFKWKTEMDHDLHEKCQQDTCMEHIEWEVCIVLGDEQYILWLCGHHAHTLIRAIETDSAD